MNIIRTLFFIFLLILVVVILALGALYFFLDPNKMKAILIAEVQNKTGYQLVMNEKLSWSFYPFLSIQVPHLGLIAPPETKPLLEANDMRFSLALWPWLKAGNKWDGNIYISTLVFNRIHAEKIRAKMIVKEKEQIVIFDSIHANLYQGEMAGSLTADYANQVRWRGQVNIDNVQIKSLLQDMQADNSNKIMVSGKGQVSLQVETQGNTQTALLQGLNGQGEFAVNEGVLEGVDIHYWLETANVMFNKEAHEPENTWQTPYQALTGTLQIHAGVAQIPDLQLIAPAFIVKGQGAIVLNAGTLHFQLQAKPQLENAKVHWAIPILITGSLNAPAIQLDVAEIPDMIPPEQIDKLKEKAAEKIEKILPGKSGAILQHFLGR